MLKCNSIFFAGLCTLSSGHEGGSDREVISGSHLDEVFHFHVVDVSEIEVL